MRSKSPQERLDELWEEVWAEFVADLPAQLRGDLGEDTLESFQQGWYESEMPALRKFYLKVYRARFRKYRRCPEPGDILAEVLEKMYETLQQRREELENLAES